MVKNIETIIALLKEHNIDCEFSKHPIFDYVCYLFYDVEGKHISVSCNTLDDFFMLEDDENTVYGEFESTEQFKEYINNEYKSW